MRSTFASFMRALPLKRNGGWTLPRTALVPMAVLIVTVASQAGHEVAAQGSPSNTAAAPTHSTTIALTSDEERLVVVNREANSVSIIRVKNNSGNDVANKIAEIGVGEEPRCVAVAPDDRFAYVTNGISGTVSVVNLRRLRVVSTIDVGTEPRGCALTPNGTLLYVANHTEGTVAIVDTASRTVVGKVDVGRNPTAIAITNNGDNSDADETVFVTQIFAELDPDFHDTFGVGGEMRDRGKRGVVHAFAAGEANPTISKITVSARADSGFFASRANFCLGAHPAHQSAPVFCPDPALPATNPVNAQNQQGMFPNQLLSALIRGNRLYLPNIAAQPEPPEKFDVNVQALVSAVDTSALSEVVEEGVNLNQQIDIETAA